ncbi:hypothetical protein E2986_13352 [Frieseomelitta varia]|uniref:Uncharacterized protein n=1 Tax=Frieseomelitta varia TaxID=561572 RepID=A0A833RJQ1_9HYME|nr:hypothetical protein E2986_13352 [Frieseomelitta varia]
MTSVDRGGRRCTGVQPRIRDDVREAETTADASTETRVDFLTAHRSKSYIEAKYIRLFLSIHYYPNINLAFKRISHIIKDTEIYIIIHLN